MGDSFSSLLNLAIEQTLYFVFMCAEPLSTYPSHKLLSSLKVHQWVKLGIHFGLTKDQIETIRSCQNPTAETFLAAKKGNIELKWKEIVQSLLAVGEYELAERVCIEQGWSYHGRVFLPPPYLSPLIRVFCGLF